MAKSTFGDLKGHFCVGWLNFLMRPKLSKNHNPSDCGVAGTGTKDKFWASLLETAEGSREVEFPI